MPDGGPRRWQEGVEPALRRRVLEKILGKLVQLYESKPAPSHDLNRIATSFEHKMFCEANSKDDYIKRIAHKMLVMERNRQPVPQAASGLNQQVQMGCNMMKPVNNMIQATQSGDSSATTAIPQVPLTMGSHERQSPRMQSLPITACPVAPKVHIKNGQQTDDAVAVSDQVLKSSPAIATPSSSPCVHPSQLMMRTGESRSQNKLLPVMQTRPVNFSCGNSTSVAQPQGQQVVQPNGQQNLLNQSARGTCMPPQQQPRINQQGLEVNRQKMNRENSKMLVAQQRNNVAEMQTGHPRERNSQQNAVMDIESTLQTNKHVKMENRPLITVNQQSSLPIATPQTAASMGSVGEVDWREEMFQQMQVLRHAYLSELVELDQVSVVPRITKEEFESLPKDKAEQYRFRVYMKKRIRTMLNFLQVQKSNIPEHLRGQLPMFVKAIQNVLGYYRRKEDQRAEMDTGHQSRISHKKPQIMNLTGDPAPSSGCTSRQKEQPAQPVAFHLRQSTATRTPSASTGNHSNILLGVASSCVPVRSPGSVQSLSSNGLQDNPIKGSSHSASEKSSIFSSPVAKPGAVVGASPSLASPNYKPGSEVASLSAPVKSTTASPVAMLGLQAALTCAPARSSSPSPVTKAGNVKVATPPASASTLLPSPAVEKVGVARAASPCLPVRPAVSPLGPNNAGAVLVTSPSTSMKSTSSATVETVSTLLQQDSAEAVASNGSTTNLLMPSPLLQAETVGIQADDPQQGGAERPVAKKKPIDRLIDAMRSLSPAELKSSANSICSVIIMDDWVTHEEEDSNTFEHWTFSSTQGGSIPPNRMKRVFEITAEPPLVDTWEVEANAEHGSTKRQKTQDARNAILDEIESANSMLMDTVASIADDDDSRTTDRNGITRTRDGTTLVELSYTAVSLAPDLRSFLATSETPVVTPAKLLVPADYPRSSPVPVHDDQRDEQRRGVISASSVDVAFRDTLAGIPEPRSIGETARAWDACVRRAVAELARRRFGGGVLSSACGLRWEDTSGGA